ncbi:hypothetical protein DFH11DRAFT_1597930 [Phellopilus nigrolimitatus]|nr:hypothetical protein DFH11DRAFT_1597930 [Phellopilus nigrolimitatus]
MRVRVFILCSKLKPLRKLSSETMLEPNSLEDLDHLRAWSEELGNALPFLRELTELLPLLRKGMKKLPDEILVNIFTHAYYSFANRYINIPSPRSNVLIKTVSQVCRRFRFLAFSCHELWSVIHSSQPKKEVAAFVEHSDSVGLTILIYGKDHMRFGSDMSEKDLRDFMEVLAPCQDRWKEIRISSTPSRTISQLMREVQVHVVSLPRLERLHVHRYKWDSDFDDHCDVDAWRAPNMRLFQGSGVVPTNFQSCALSHISLTCQVNTIPEIFAGRPPPHLEYISIKILNVADRAVIALGASDEPICLPALETLEVSSTSPGTYTTFWVLILPKLAFPRLANLHVRVAGDKVIDLFARLGTHQFARLTSLRFACEDLAIVLGMLRALAKFPSLRHLAVDDCCYSSYKEGRDATGAEFTLAALPPLQTLTFSRCRFNNMHGVEALVERLSMVLDLAVFECLRFSCYDLDELRWERADVLCRLLGGKVAFVDCVD